MKLHASQTIFFLSSLAGFEPARQRYLTSQKPNTLTTELSHRVLSKHRRNGTNAGAVVFERRSMVVLTDSPPYLLEERLYLQVN